MKCYLNQNFDEGFFVTIEPFDEKLLHSDKPYLINSKSSWTDGVSGPVEIPEELYKEYLAAQEAVDILETQIFDLFYTQHKVKR